MLVVVIVTYNGRHWIDQVIKSLLDSTVKPRIIVVDNNSSDNTVHLLRQNFEKEIILLELKKNLGFGKGNNVGLREARKLDPEYIFLLNQDARVEKDTLEKLLIVARENPDYGIISPVHLTWDGKILEECFSNFVSVHNSPGFYSDHVLGRNPEEIYDTAFVNAAAWLIPSHTLNKVGGFDPIFWHYGEDDNYCQRVLYHNLKIGVVPKAYIRHDSGKRNYFPKKIFSEQFYDEYSRALMVRYANLNNQADENSLSFEKRKIWKMFIRNYLDLNFHSPASYYKLLKLIDRIFVDIFKSRKINVIPGPHYL